MVLRWIFALVAVIVSFIVAAILGAFAAGLVASWETPIAGFCAAFAVVAVAYLTAPSHMLLSAFVAFLFGAIAAWFLLEPSWYPESYRESAYQPTHLPLMVTYAGGALGLLVVAGHRLRQYARKRGNSPGDRRREAR